MTVQGVRERRVQTNGITLNVAERGEGPLVLLLHGFPESWYSWRHQFAALADAGYHAVAPDMRGYGKSEAPDAIEAYNQIEVMRDIVGLIPELGQSGPAPLARGELIIPPASVGTLFHAAIPVDPDNPDTSTATIWTAVPVRSAPDDLFGNTLTIAVVPEPSAALFLIAAALVARRRRVIRPSA